MTRTLSIGVLVLALATGGFGCANMSKTGRGAAIGAATGAVAGAVVGSFAFHPWTGAAIGAAGGALVGSIVGHCK